MAVTVWLLSMTVWSLSAVFNDYTVWPRWLCILAVAFSGFALGLNIAEWK